MIVAFAAVAALAGLACLVAAGWIVHPSLGLGVAGAGLMMVAVRVAGWSADGGE